MANSDSEKVDLDLEAADYTEGIFFERRFLWWIGNGLTIFQESVSLAIITSSIVVSSVLSFVLIKPGLITSIGFVLLWLFAGVFVGLTWAKSIDVRNKDMKKTQPQFVLDNHHARRLKGRWVNGRKWRPSTRITTVFSVATLHLRKGDKLC